MRQVNIYLYTTIRSPKRCDGAYIYRLETETARGPGRLEDTQLVHGMTSHQADLCALAAAVKRLTRSCALTIYTDSAYLAAGVEKWLPAWREKGWKNARGSEIANADMWHELADLLNGHEYTFVVGAYHFYYFDMKTEAEKAAAGCTK